jgi:chitodextrinase
MRHQKPQLIILTFLAFALLLGGCAAKNQPPTVKIISPLDAAQLGSQVQFQGQAQDPDGQIKSIRWDFGDGSSGDQLNVTHAYKKDGNYTATLIVTDDKGATARASVAFHVQALPKAVATIQQIGGSGDVVLKVVSGEVPLIVQFDASHSSAPPGETLAGYHWDFGDGSKGDGESTTHTYEKGGSYQATLTVSSSGGQQASDQVQIEAQALEALDQIIDVGTVRFHYKLYQKHATSAAVNNYGMLYWYAVDAPQRTTPDQARAILLDIITKAMQRPGVTKITAFLFDKEKPGFMRSGDFSHYLGYAFWESPKTVQEGTTYYLNQGYFNGRSKTVLGYKLEEKVVPAGTPNCPACAQNRIVLVNLYLQDGPICRGDLLNTIQEVASGNLVSEGDRGYLINIYSKDSGAPLGAAIGVYKMPLDQLPLGLLAQPPHWSVETNDLKIDFGNIPACSS